MLSFVRKLFVNWQLVFLWRLISNRKITIHNIIIAGEEDRFKKKCIYTLGKTHQKVAFLVVGPLRFYPPYTNGLVVHATPLVVRPLKTLFLCLSSLSKRSKYGFEKSMVFGNIWHHFVHNPIAWENKISGFLKQFFL